MVLARLALKAQVALPVRLSAHLPLNAGAPERRHAGAVHIPAAPVHQPLLGHQHTGTPEHRYAGTLHTPAAPVHQPRLGYRDAGTPDRRIAGSLELAPAALVGKTCWSSHRASWEAAPAAPAAVQEAVEGAAVVALLP